ncbi:MAG: thioredoxin family protein [Candidatus Aenigmatarchaeota archaeon]
MMENHSHLSKNEKEELKRILNEKLKNEIEIEVILDYENNFEFSHLTEHLCKEISELSDKLKFNFYDSKDKKTLEVIEKYNLKLDKKSDGPIIFYKKHPNIIHFGFPLGMEFPVFLEEIEFISSQQLSIPLNLAKTISKIDKNIDILVFVTSSCPYCPYMSLPSHKFAFLNKKIRGIVVESEQFPNLADKFDVLAVPKTVIIHENEIKDDFEGAIPANQFAETILKSIEY